MNGGGLIPNMSQEQSDLMWAIDACELCYDESIQWERCDAHETEYKRLFPNGMAEFQIKGKQK